MSQAQAPSSLQFSPSVPMLSSPPPSQLQSQTKSRAKTRVAAPQTQSVPVEEEKVPKQTAKTYFKIETKKPRTEADEESLERLPVSDACGRIFKGNSYRYRNVYKSIVRNMYSYIKNNRTEITKILSEAGYGRAAMEHAFLKINDYNDKEHKRGGNKMAQEILKKIISRKNIYAYILREATNAMLQHGKSGNFGRVAAKNMSTYTTVVEEIYSECTTVLGGLGAEGKSFVL
ncbi:MAG: hypothetical protein P4M11_11635 [Candidatus Pacebacteria bacterium]|nr:hypothetical protein [Candidatus Paceibacterota bacterium]